MKGIRFFKEIVLNYSYSIKPYLYIFFYICTVQYIVWGEFKDTQHDFMRALADYCCRFVTSTMQ